MTGEETMTGTGTMTESAGTQTVGDTGGAQTVDEMFESAFNEGEKAQETAAPAAEETGSGEKTGETSGKTGAGAEDAAGAADAEGAKQSKEENAAYAAARRKAEADAKAKTDALEAGYREAIKSLGLTFSDGKPIETKEDLEKYQSERSAQKFEAAKKRTGLSDKDFEELINASPEVAQAKKELAQLKEERQKAARLAVQNQLDADIAAVGKLNPSIKSFEDLRSLDRYDQIYANVKRGLTVSEAYKLAYMDDILAANSKAAAQGARNAVSGKSHMQSTDAAGAAGKEIPLDELREMREWFPDMTDAQIREKWAKHHR